MKKTLNRKGLSKLHSFTLVELLVVIAIIAILAGVLFTAGGAAIRAAQRARAANLANQLQSATTAYFTEYSVYPVPITFITTPKDYSILDTDGASWTPLMDALCGNIKPSTGVAVTTAGTISNLRGIPFLSMKASDVDAANDAPKNPIPSTTAKPYFNIAMDSDYDGILGISPSAVTILPNFGAGTFNTAAANGGGTSTAGVAVWANCNTQSNTTNAGFYVRTY